MFTYNSITFMNGRARDTVSWKNRSFGKEIWKKDDKWITNIPLEKSIIADVVMEEGEEEIW